MSLSEKQIIKELGLSSEQAKALSLTEDTVVAAGAGAGKTTTLVASVVCDLLVHGHDPESICVCTFTRAAAASLQARTQAALSLLAGPQAPDMSSMWIGTIDSLCARILRSHALEVGIDPSFSVAEARDLRH